MLKTLITARRVALALVALGCAVFAVGVALVTVPGGVVVAGVALIAYGLLMVDTGDRS